MAQKTSRHGEQTTVLTAAETASSAAEGTQPNKAVPAAQSRPAVKETGRLSFVTSEGEHLAFASLEMPLADAAALASEEALSKVWNRPEEDLAWRDM